MRCLLVLLIVLLAGSCTTTEYIPTETNKTDSVYISLLTRDSIYLHDSVYVREKGETVYVDKVRYLYKEKVRIDTIFSERVDSIRVPYPVERRMGYWERVYFKVGKFSVWTIVITILVLVGAMVYKLIK